MKKIIIGAAIVAVSYLMVPFAVVALALGHYIAAAVIYGLSWVVLLLGIYIGGKRTIKYLKRYIIKKFKR